MQYRRGPRRVRTVVSAALSALVLVAVIAIWSGVASAHNQGGDSTSCGRGTTEYPINENPLDGLSYGQSTTGHIYGVVFTITRIQGSHPYEDVTFNWSSEIRISRVIVTGSGGSNVYDYNPSTQSGNNVHPPSNWNGTTITRSCSAVTTNTTRQRRRVRTRPRRGPRRQRRPRRRPRPRPRRRPPRPRSRT